MSDARLLEPRCLDASSGCRDVPLGVSRRGFLAAFVGGGLLCTAGRALALGESAKLRLVRLRLADLPDPRPTALRRLAWELERRTSLVTLPEPAELPLGSPEVFRYPLAVLAGARAETSMATRRVISARSVNSRS